MTDLNKAGLAKAEASYMKRMGHGCMRPDEASALRAAITAYLDATGGGRARVATFDLREELIAARKIIVWLADEAMMPQNGILSRIDAALAAAPTPETREPSEKAITKLMSCGVAWRDTAKVIDALRAAYQIDFPAAPKAPSAEGWRTMESAPKDGTAFLAAIYVTNHRIGKSKWEMHAVWVNDDTGNIDDDVWQGWSLSDYSHWMPLPPAPPMKGE